MDDTTTGTPAALAAILVTTLAWNKKLTATSAAA